MDILAASIVHDLRNPLAAICGCAEMLLQGNLAPAQTRQMISNIRRAASRMRELVNHFACNTREHAEGFQSCNLRAVLNASCEAAGASEREGIEILMDVPEQVEIPLPRIRFERVFVNLIVNALEAMPEGGAIWITARQADDRALIAIEDNGPGIPAAIRSRLFEPFVTAGKKEGLGLGLALARRTVRDHGGELWVEPSPGARFVVSWPLPAGEYSKWI
jgi:signal transduction histidine kinase